MGVMHAEACVEREIVEAPTGSERLDALRRATACVGHDFNNLVTIIARGAELLRDRVDEPALRNLADEIRAAGERASELIAYLVKLADGRSERASITDINDVVRDVAPLMKRLILPAELDVQLTTRSVFAQVSPIDVHSMLLNLAANARDAMSSHGVMRVETQRLGSTVRITVADNGEGMAPEIAQRIFEPYFTTKKASGGTGLGLYGVRRTVANYGGTISVDTSPGRGARFGISLPAANG